MTTAVRIHRFGSPEVMQVEDIPRPVPASGEVLIDVHAAGVGRWDALIRSGRSAIPQVLPLTLGADVSGTVAEVGAGVNTFKPGDPVFGVTNPQFIGSYARHAVATAAMLARKPANLDFAQAASIPVVAVTAWQMLFDHGGVEKGRRVLILGAAGNVGAYAVQLAHRAGAVVIGTARPGEFPYVRSLGADDAIDSAAERFDRLIAPVDVAIDTIGGAFQARSFAALKAGGILISAVSDPAESAAVRSDVRTRYFIVDVTTARLTKIANLFTHGDLSANVGLLVPFQNARRAHELLEQPGPRPRGKIVLTVSR